MKLDLLKVKEILQYIDTNGGIVSNTALINHMPAELSIDKVAYSYLKILKEIRAIDSSDETVGYNWKFGDSFEIEEASIELTFLGRQVLESLSNRTLLIELTNGAREVGFDRLRNIPALAIQAIFEKV